jgi:hypothetical protein
VAQFRYLGTTVTNKNLIQEKIKRGLNWSIPFNHSVQNLLSSRLLSKHRKIIIYGTIFLPIVLYGPQNLEQQSVKSRGTPVENHCSKQACSAIALKCQGSELYVCIHLFVSARWRWRGRLWHHHRDVTWRHRGPRRQNDQQVPTRQWVLGSSLFVCLFVCLFCLLVSSSPWISWIFRIMTSLPSVSHKRIGLFIYFRNDLKKQNTKLLDVIILNYLNSIIFPPSSCGGWLECLQRNPAGRTRRRKGNQMPRV